MVNKNLANIRMLHYIATKLGALNDEVVFLGGCTTGLFITDHAAPDVRYTLDVDCIVDIISHSQYYKFEDNLRQLGFKQSLENDVICRWYYENIILDVMPTDEKILGFSNRWYKDAIKHSTSYHLSDNLEIRIVTSAYFLATKLEAFKNRGQMDFYGSHDFEDIISLLDGRVEVVAEIKHSPKELRNYLIETLIYFEQNRDFQDALPGHFNPYGALAHDRINLLLQKIQKITTNE